jgi:hypothetical protein
LRVAVIGMGKTQDQTPWNDPWEFWGLPWHPGFACRMTRLFEMHDLNHWDQKVHKVYSQEYLQGLRGLAVPLYMQEAYPEVPNATAYPFESVVEAVGDYFNSSLGYMVALAITEGAEEIGVFGVDLVGPDEYGYQKPNMEYLIGLARGKGIKVTIPKESGLCKFNPRGTGFEYVERYGKLR